MNKTQILARHSCCDGFCGAEDCYKCRGEAAWNYLLEQEEQREQDEQEEE